MLAALAVIGAILLSSLQPSSINQEVGSESPGATSDNGNGERSSLPPETIELSEDVYETAYGRSGALQGKFFTATDFRRFNLDLPERVKFRADLRLSELSALLAPDNIPSIDTPKYESVIDADEWLEDVDIVLTVVHEGLARAYPTRILNWHEIVNDQFGDVPVSITFCPLCNSGIIFVRPEINGARPEFGTSGRVYRSDLVMYDRETLTFWSQIEGRPIVGPFVGEWGRLEQIPAGMTQWGLWKEAYPNSDVLSRPTTDLRLGGSEPLTSSENATIFSRQYNINPYAAYITDNGDTFGTPFSDHRLPAKADVVGIRFGDALAKAYVKESVQTERLINDQLGSHAVLVLWDEASGDVLFYDRKLNGEILEFALVESELVDKLTNSLWDQSGTAIEGPMADDNAVLEPIPGMTTFWFAWFNFHPHTELFVIP